MNYVQTESIKLLIQEIPDALLTLPRVLIAEAKQGNLPVAWRALASEEQQLFACTHQANDWDRLQTQAGLHKFAILTSSLPVAGSDFDAVVCELGEDRAFNRRLLLSSFAAIAENGFFYTIIASDAGKSFQKDLQAIFGNCELVHLKHRYRMLLCQKTQSDIFEPETFWLTGKDSLGVVPGTFKTHDTEQGEIKVRAGVSGFKKVDKATDVLCRTLKELPITDFTVWNVGCGVGRVGFAAAKLGAKQVCFSDVSMLAMDDCCFTAEAYDLPKNTQFIAADVCQACLGDSAPTEIDWIICNPDFGKNTVSRTMLEDLIAQAPEHLQKYGRLLIVADRHHSVARSAEAHFDRIEDVSAHETFAVWLMSGLKKYTRSYK